MMQFPVATFTEITEFGNPVPPEGGSHLGWVKAPVEELEQRFLKHNHKHGTVVITKDGVLLQATKVRGSSKSREIYFAASDNSAHAVLKVKPSDIFVSDREEGFNHVFLDILGQEFKAQLGQKWAQVRLTRALSFAVSGLLAAAKDKVLKSGVRRLGRLLFYRILKRDLSPSFKDSFRCGSTWRFLPSVYQ